MPYFDSRLLQAGEGAARAVLLRPLTAAIVVAVLAAVPAAAMAAPERERAATAAKGESALVRFTTRGQLLNAAADFDLELAFEDFNDGYVRFLPQNEFAACIEPVSHRSDDACFAPGHLEPGFAVRSHNRFGVLMFGSEIAETGVQAIGAWPYQASPSPFNFTQFEFDPAITFAGMQMYGYKIVDGWPSGDVVPVLVEAFDAEGGLIGSFEILPEVYNEPEFVGFFSPVPVAMLQLGARVPISAVLIDDMHFGGEDGRAVAQPQAVGFGGVPVGATASASVTVTNAGVLDLVLETVPDPGPPFSIAVDGCSGATLAAGDSCAIDVAFAPAYADAFDATLAIGAASGSGTEVTVQGNGVVGAAGGGQ